MPPLYFCVCVPVLCAGGDTSGGGGTICHTSGRSAKTGKTNRNNTKHTETPQNTAKLHKTKLPFISFFIYSIN